jgi:DNA modification methylase
MKDYRKVSELKLWEQNPRSIKEKDFERLKKQIKELGQYKPLLITKEGEVIGGNMRLRAYRDLGIEEVWVSVVNPKNEAEKLAYALSDNDRAGYYDDDLLSNLSSAYPDFDWSGYAVDLNPPETLDKVLMDINEVTEDEVPEVSDEEPVSKLGEVYQLGKHRLMCGDSTKIEDVEKLMNGQKADMVFTDPPYGMNLDTDYTSLNSKLEFVRDKHLKSKTGNKYDKVIGDDTDYNPQHLFDMFADSKEMFLWGGDYYCKRLPDGGSWIVWDKRQGEQFDKMYGSCFELLWSRVRHKRDIIRHTWAGVFGTEQEDVRGRVHPTQKPIGVSSWVLEKYSKDGWLVVDLFGGSGSTLIACEQINRTCFMMELDPKYVDVIRKRYAKLIGKEEEWEKATPREN